MKRVKIILPALLGLMTIPAMAQETYQDAKLAETALTGTARYVGMGGAMEALGADLSTISTNPAGIGMFRKSQAALSAGVLAQSSADKNFTFDGTNAYIDGKNSKVSFDQIGFVWSMATRLTSTWHSTSIRVPTSCRFSRQPVCSTVPHSLSWQPTRLTTATISTHDMMATSAMRVT